MINRLDEIADMFMKFFHHYGFKKTSVDDVSSELHISKKTIYEYFESKDAVFAYIIQREADKSSNQMISRLQDIPSSIEKVRELIRMIFETAGTYLKSSQGLDFRDKDEIASQSFKKAYEIILKAIIEEGNKSGEMHYPCTNLNLEFLNAIIWQGLQALMNGTSDLPEKSTGDTILKLLA